MSRIVLDLGCVESCMDRAELGTIWQLGYNNVMSGESNSYDKELELDGQKIRFELKGGDVHLYKTDRLPDLIHIDPNGEKSDGCQTESEFLDRVQRALDSGW